MKLHGRNLLGFETSTAGGKSFRAYDPRKGQSIEPVFHEATAAEVERAMELAGHAASLFAALDADAVMRFLLAIREEILALGEQLIERADEETALGVDRLRSERDRTVNQIKLFADIVSEGSWVDARIDTALPDRKPLPRPDIRRMLQPIGPVAVFGASNFPLAFSVGGGDTISAFAARNPVVVKSHPAHPGTSELVGTAIVTAAKAAGMPEGTFSMLHSLGTDASIALVTHPKTNAVAFTGSQRAGRALFDAGARRPNPIPVYAEMGSVNPVFLLPEVLHEKGDAIAAGLYRSVLLGVGQFCTCPGLVFGLEDNAFRGFVQQLQRMFEQGIPGTMLNTSIQQGFAEKFKTASAVAGVGTTVSTQSNDPGRTEALPGLLMTDAGTWLKNEMLHEEIFGPATVVVGCRSSDDLLRCGQALEGSLTATIHGTAAELEAHRELVSVLATKAGRLIFNGYPTGVEVGYAMHHGGPYPATTDVKFTSVGAAAIYRFARPVCYQGFPERLLPQELQNANPRNIWRIVDGHLTRDAL
ncbi:MAG TPA: aldehyde dehydrogenase (NADP(+)) [Bryobacteraceae bacterium]|jgi:NADP-dependent aldehyde dehydrogenase